MMGFGSDNKHSGNQSESRRVIRNFISTPSSSPLSRFADRKMEIMKTVGVLLLVAWAAPRTLWRHPGEYAMPTDRSPVGSKRSVGLPRGVWALGFVSMFMDISSEMVHALLLVYLVAVLGTSTLTVGFIEGIAEATANITKIFSGTLSDWLGKRKLLTGIGYGLAAFTKPIFPLASTVGWVVAARFIARIGKGIRDAPRDALIADIAPADLRGASFGLRQSLDTVGAVAGPLLGIALMALSSGNFCFVFWIAVLPAFISLAVMVFAVQEPAQHEADTKPRLRFADARRLSGRYWTVVGVATILTLARFSEAFLILRSKNVGLPVALVPAVMVVMNVVYALAAYPAGVLCRKESVSTD
jgi:hypothetical protein